MSRETTEWLNRNILRGFTAKRGHAWHYTAAAQGDETNHYDGAIPVADLHRRLFGWTAVACPLNFQLPETADMPGVSMPIDGHVAWVRSDTYELLGIHSDGYRGHQYGQWLVEYVETILDGDVQVANAGLLRGGSIAYVQVEMPDNVDMPGGVVMRPFVMATTSFDGSIATTYKTGATDVVCDNTRAAFLAEKTETYRVRHTKNSKLDVSAAREVLQILERIGVTMSREVEALLSVKVTDKEWQKFVEAHAPIGDETSKRSVTFAETRRAALTKLYRHDVRVAPWAGTAWGVIQAVDTYRQHEAIVRNVTRYERNMTSAIQGKGTEENRAALADLSGVLGRDLSRELVTA